jgi:serine/threonine protein kinase/Tfp pilus assembly protein PilF
MSASASGRTWEEASSPAAVRLARRFEAAWRNAADRGSGSSSGSGTGHTHGFGSSSARGRERDGAHPDPDDFLPDDPQAYPGARLALLRADLALRWETGERVGAEWYRRRYPDLGDETLVALIYEEFCLREEHGEAPDPIEYFERFPEVAAPLRRVLDIHGLVGSGSAETGSLPASSSGCTTAVVFPETGQTIAGFHLVEELGRGSFARVFLAQERQLADRLVALKVARAGSREPQTLARLQHTHIVPVYSSRTDPATGLHLLWMPYFGRLTLARILADAQVRAARSGSDLVEVLDRLGPREGPPPGRAAGRVALARRSFPRAIAWWGARMAEALDHAHDRGVLHRDIKPSNVLVTSDAMPMLLDFNLAREPLTSLDDTEAAPAALGGTLDYMAPEHLDSLVDGLADRLDGRADIYSLGVLLFEALLGLRPFISPRSAASAADLLSRAAAERRREAPRLRTSHPEVPVALEVVVRRCLAPDPNDRYAAAGELAADLQAVADDQPLRFAREPWPGRVTRWIRRRWRLLAVLGLLAVTLALALGAAIQTKLVDEERRAKLEGYLARGAAAVEDNRYAEAMAWFGAAASLADGHSGLEEMHRQARNSFILAKETRETRDHADNLFRVAKPLRFRLIRLCGDLTNATRELRAILHPFFVLENHDWTSRPEMNLLDAPRRAQLVREVNELLFLWIVALDRDCEEATSAAAATTMKKALEACQKGLVFARPAGPWAALEARLKAWPRRIPGSGSEDADQKIEAETSALACFQWGLLRAREGHRAAAIAWFRQAAKLEPSSYWFQYYLAYKLDEPPREAIHAGEALGHYETAVALEPEAPWVLYCRARLYHQRSAWGLALEDLHRARSDFEKLAPFEQDADFLRKVQLEFGVIHQALGDTLAARKDYAAVIGSDPAAPSARAARTNLARIDAESGARDRARATYDDLLAEDPDDDTARLGRALLALQCSRLADAEADLTEALKRQPNPGNVADLLANRAVARLLLDRVAEADADAEAASRVRPTPGHRRLRTRTLLALGGVEELPLDDPEEIARLPLPGPSLRTSLRAAADQLQAETSPVRSTPAGLRAVLTRAVVLAALGDPAAEAEADRAVALAPLSAEVHLIRARVRRYLGRLDAARDDVEFALALQPSESRLWELRGRLKTDAGDPRGALADFDRALQLGAGARARGPRARALLALGQAESAIRDWTLALEYDPEDPRAFLGRARAFLQLAEWDHARADLEQAAAWTDDWSGLGLQIVLGYARCLPARREQLPRVLALTARVLWARSLGLRGGG